MIEGLRTVIDTVKASQAGGMRTCTRSPVGREADNTGLSEVMALPLKLAIRVASCRQCAKLK